MVDFKLLAVVLALVVASAVRADPPTPAMNAPSLNNPGVQDPALYQTKFNSLETTALDHEARLDSLQATDGATSEPPNLPANTTIGTVNPFTAPTTECNDNLRALYPEGADIAGSYRPYATTISQVWCIAEGGGTVSLAVSQCDNNGTTGCVAVNTTSFLCDADGLPPVSSFDNAAVAAGKILRFSWTVIAPVTSFAATVCRTRPVVQ